MREKIFNYDCDKKWDYENGFYLTSHVTRLAKMLAHFELYKTILGLPGHVVECGVYKGASLIRFATFRDILESPYSRKIIGFDAFGKFPRQSDLRDAKFVRDFEKDGGDGIPAAELEKAFRLKALTNVQLISGDILETVPRFVSDHPEQKIALLHVDVDVYEPTVAILQHLYDKVVKGGLIVFDDYGTVDGETRAVDEFFRRRDIAIKKSPISRDSSMHVGTSWLISC